jgi:hypothetical protein
VESAKGEDNYTLAAYYFPNFHPGDPRNEEWHGPGWTEWDLMKQAGPRFPGHAQPKVPLWGYEDESDPAVMAKKIDAAADHGVDVFIFDWYWYEDGPYLDRAIEKGFLQAPNTDRLKFALMWANHDWLDIQPAKRMKPYNTLADGKVSPEAFKAATDHMIETYFGHPSYWRVNGGLYMSFYDLSELLNNFGSVEATRAALDDFRARVRDAGYGKLHLNAVVWGRQVLPNEQPVENVNELLDQLGFDSITSYVWLHHQPMPDFPKTSYARMQELSAQDYVTFTDRYELPYFPNVSMGWDPSPRTVQTDVYENLGYPFTPTLEGNTPEAFKKALQDAKAFLDQGRTTPKILTLNAWNEWTEGSYFEPDTVHGMAYLEAIREVFRE